ncbi:MULTISPECIES: hypothetical protein [unclassified Pseudoalteromonas]|uniref:hypothetical protein n=1 Tax=unclassified Pseudoalteromonas TaxID=194690 RepID=UPI00110B7DCD|nr:hypothetical protein [Pseudoalteromonas sp. S558]TMN95548.1 hypothetical protein CWB66_18435 [Pseudoalteromonas sp. S558]
MLLSLLKPEYGYYALFLMSIITFSTLLFWAYSIRKEREKVKEYDIEIEAKNHNMSVRELLNKRLNEDVKPIGNLKKFVNNIYEKLYLTFMILFFCMPVIMAVYSSSILIFADSYFIHFITYATIWFVYGYFLIPFIEDAGEGGMIFMLHYLAFIIVFIFSILIVIIRWLIEVIW